MKVIYDISTVGNRPEARTGVSRVAWTTASLLYEKLGNNVSFSACGSISAAIQAEDLLNQHTELRSAIQPVSALAKHIHRYQENLDKSFKRYPTTEQVLTNLSRFLNITRKPINSYLLQEANVFHSPYARIPRQVRQALPGRHVLTVNDLTPLLLPERYFADGQRAITKRMIDSVQPDDWVITISESTRRDLCNYRRVNPEKVITVHLAASEELFYPVEDADVIEKMRKKYQLPFSRYLLTLHSLAPHKNLPHLIRSFGKFIEQEKIDDLTLVICGGQGRSRDEILQSLNIAQSDLDQVCFIGYVEDEDLAALYSGALGFIFPSLYEGFGLPVLEAMQCGCPIIASNISSIPEVVGNAGILIDPQSEVDLCEAMYKLCENQFLSTELKEKTIKQASKYSWKNSVQQLLQVYSQVVSQSK